MLSLNFATLLAQQGKRVLLVDADLRRPIIHQKLRLPRSGGLSSYLAGENGADALSGILPLPDVAGLYILPAGPLPPYPAELLGSEQMRTALREWRERFDFIILDGSPVLPVTDSVILSSMTDFTLLLARYKVTKRQSLDRSFRVLRAQTGDQKIGIVLNAINREGSSYYEYYGYSDSKYYGDRERRLA
jgi:capsular exopolysaccharide synthesis family protein